MEIQLENIIQETQTKLVEVKASAIYHHSHCKTEEDSDPVRPVKSEVLVNPRQSHRRLSLKKMAHIGHIPEPSVREHS